MSTGLCSSFLHGDAVIEETCSDCDMRGEGSAKTQLASRRIEEDLTHLSSLCTNGLQLAYLDFFLFFVLYYNHLSLLLCCPKGQIAATFLHCLSRPLCALEEPPFTFVHAPVSQSSLIQSCD